jgi:hypothetical protein
VLLVRQSGKPASAGVSAAPLSQRGAAATFWLRF